MDLAILAVPAVASALSLFAMRSEGGHPMPLWAFLLLIVAFDVAHVWGTIYVTYMDREIFQKRRLLYLLPIPIAFAVAFRLHSFSASLYWSLLAYIAIYHFIQQQWGFIALYKARALEQSSFDYHLDKWTLWVGALGPVLLWHASPARQFDWFNAGESFIATIDPIFKPDIMALMVAFAVVYVARQVQRHVRDNHFNIGKNIWMVCSWVSWSVGIGLSNHPLVSAAFLNLFHGIPFLAIVWYRCNRRWEGRTEGPSPLLAWLSQRRRWLAFYSFIFAFAIVEELFWDGIVWRIYVPKVFGWEGLHVEPMWLSFWVALLSVPQIVHYFLDAFIWKLDRNNTDLVRSVSSA